MDIDADELLRRDARAEDEDDEASQGEGMQGVEVDELAIDANQRYQSGALSSAAARAEAEAISAAIDARAIGRSMAVPADDASVRHRLRSMGEPVTCFGERKADRRERLREVLVKLKQRRIEEGEREVDVESVRSESVKSEQEQDEEFFTEGTQALLQARRDMAIFSLAAAKRRVEKQRLEAQVPLTTIVAVRKQLYAPLRKFTSLGSQIGDNRPISVVRFSPSASISGNADGTSLLATGSWEGSLKLWDVPSARERRALRGHEDKVGGVAWHPRATVGQSSTAANLVSGAGDGNVLVWNLESDRPISKLVGHKARVARVAYHPMGRHAASASFDGTWRLWDVEASTELLLQEGHSKEVYAIGFQDDGALCCSGGLDAIGRVWDTRTGRTAMVLDGHAREILSLDFAPNGYQIATASGDDTIRIWDMRALKCLHVIPAHKSSVSDVRFFRSRDERKGAASVVKKEEGDDAPAETNGDGDATTAASGQGAESFSRSGLYLASSGYDGLVKLWSADDWQLLRSMSGDAGKVMSVDVSPDGECVASGEWGRTFKLWGNL